MILSTNHIEQLAAFGKALSDPTRQKIMKLVCCQWKNVTELVEDTGMAQSTVSHHLAILKQTGLVHSRNEGKQSYYTLNQDAIFKCCENTEQIYAPEICDLP